MYGIIHVCFREMIMSKFGQQQLDSIMSEAGMDSNTDFLHFRIYPDEMTTRMVQASIIILGIKLETLLDIFGEYFLQFAFERGYGDMLRGLGSSFEVFIENINYLHWYLMSTAYPGITSPSFTCHEENGDIILRYYSYRSGFHPLAVGLLRAIARELFQLSATFEILDSKTECLSETVTLNCVFFKVHLFPIDGPKVITNNLVASPILCVEFDSEHISDNDPLISSKVFCKLLPYHVIFDSRNVFKKPGSTCLHNYNFSGPSSLCILQLGSSLSRWCPEAAGMRMDVLFTLQWPSVPLTFHNVSRFGQLVFQLALKHPEGLVLKGEMIPLKTNNGTLFMGVPFLRNLQEMHKLTLRLSDLPKHDSARELILLQHQRSTELDLMQKLEEMTVALRSTATALEAEKARTEELLHSLLPAEVASKLKRGERVQESFAECTVLFSDIVGFTEMASVCSPLQVVDVLNALYSGFDALTEEYDVYKVETVGDAYMVVGGVPIANTDHAERVARQALGMLTHSRSVTRPDDHSVIRIRVGLHTGPVVAGCVGMKMPRYCLFGDTVNTASRMESHGLPGAVHISDNTRRALQGKGFQVVLRGSMTVKGKGVMDTFFLVPPGEDPPVENPQKVQSQLCLLL